MHIAFQLESYEALRDAYLHLSGKGVTFRGATNHVNQRSLYVFDPDGNILELYYELPHSRQLFPNGRVDLDERLPVTKPGEPPPAWIYEDWPGPAVMAQIAAIEAGQKAAE
jgi:catechol-2,3-dioxygenase